MSAHSSIRLDLTQLKLQAQELLRACQTGDPDARTSLAEKHPKLGWISLADEMAKAARKLGDMTIYDELVWLGYKVGTHFDPKTASRVTLEDVELDVGQFFVPMSHK